MTASLSPLVKQQFFDDSGNPLVSGKLYAYIAGTNTPVATYKTAAGSDENTHPIILNARGECDIWLLSTVAYKFKLCDSDNVEIYTVDSITVGAGGSGGTVDWSAITNKPTTFTPSPHNQSWTTITDKPTSLAGYNISDAYTKTEVDEVTNNLQTQIDASTSSIDDLTVRVENLETAVSAINTDITNLEAADVNLQTQIDGNTSAISVIQSNLNDVYSDINAIETNINTLSGDVTSLLESQYKVKTTSADGSADYLANKIVVGNEAINIAEDTGTVRISGTGVVKSDNSDTDPAGWGSLQDKLLAGANMTFDVVTCAGTRRLQINAITSGIDPVLGDHKVAASLTDPSYGTLDEKLINVDGSTFSVVTCGGVQKVQIAADTYKIKATSGTTEGYLDGIILAGTGITKLVVGDQVQLTAEGSTKVRVNSADTNPDYLASKVIGSENISVTTSANNVLVISAAGSFDTYKVKSTSGDTADYLANKVVAGDNISLSLIPYGDGEALEINLSLSGSDDSELIAGRLSVYEHIMLKTSYIAESLTQYLGGSMYSWSMSIAELSSGFASNFDPFTGIFEIDKDGMYLISYGFCPFLREYTVGLPWSTDSSFTTHIYESYDNFATSTAVVNGQFDLVRTSTFGDIHSMSWCGQIKQVQDNLGRWKKFRIGVTLQNTSSIVAATFRNSYINVTEVRKPIAIQGPKGDKGDPGDSGIAAIYGYGNIVTTSATSGVDITTTPNLSATYLTLNGNLTSAAPVGTIEYDSITDAFWITTSV